MNYDSDSNLINGWMLDLAKYYKKITLLSKKLYIYIKKK